ncbi:MAG TPA: hypothetical protein VGJ18_19255 [Gemmatimonadaceae bacterium]
MQTPSPRYLLVIAVCCRLVRGVSTRNWQPTGQCRRQHASK